MPEQAEDRPGGAGGEARRGGEQVGRDVAAEPADQVEREEPRRAEVAFQVAAENPQYVHVERQVEDPVVQEHPGDQPVVFAVGDPERDPTAADQLRVRARINRAVNV